MTKMTRNEYNTQKALGLINKYCVDFFNFGHVATSPYKRIIIVWGENGPNVRDYISRTHPLGQSGFKVREYKGTESTKIVAGIDIDDEK